jgi:hypothetical protein
MEMVDGKKDRSEDNREEHDIRREVSRGGRDREIKSHESKSSTQGSYL